MKKKFEKWLHKYYTPEYYNSIWKSKKSTAEYSTNELEEIYNSIVFKEKDTSPLKKSESSEVSRKHKIYKIYKS